MPTSAGDIFEIALVHVFQNVNECINVLHFQLGVLEDPTPAAMDADFIEFLGDTYAMIEGLMSTEVDIQELRYRNLTDDGPTRYVPWSGPYTGGTSGADSLPPGTSALILWRTGTKKVTGRTYLPPFTESAQTAGIWSAGVMGDLGAFAEELSSHWIGGSTGNEYDLRVWSKRLSASVDITGPTAKPIVAYMRRRRQGRGS